MVWWREGEFSGGGGFESDFGGGLRVLELGIFVS